MELMINLQLTGSWGANSWFYQLENVQRTRFDTGQISPTTEKLLSINPKLILFKNGFNTVSYRSWLGIFEGKGGSRNLLTFDNSRLLQENKWKCLLWSKIEDVHCFSQSYILNRSFHLISSPSSSLHGYFPHKFGIIWIPQLEQCTRTWKFLTRFGFQLMKPPNIRWGKTCMLQWCPCVRRLNLDEHSFGREWF